MVQNIEADCATCPDFTCRLGFRDLGPDSCPMKGDFPTPQELYGDREDLLATARNAAMIEGEGYRRWTRSKEIIELAQRLGVSKVGLAACKTMKLEQDIYADWLADAGFEVLRGRDAVADGQCGPREQAAFLNSAVTGLNVVMGMCVGHDSLFMHTSRALVTPLVSQDSFLRHNPAAALHTSRTYFDGPLHHAHKEAYASPMVEPGTLQEAARDPSGPAADRLEELATQVVQDGDGRWCRVEELLEFAGRAGAKTLGLVFCSGFREEAKVLNRLLGINGFKTLSIQCKAGAVPKEEMGILDSQKVRPGNKEMMCNPLAQAVVMNRSGADLNILLGQCAGHDAGTIATTEALAVSLAVKDRVLAHNTVVELYRGALLDRESA
ncbi:MAG: DUF1847 domain-containing protein [Dehalococcoidia bacterium]|nr:DUF1847 domain-containing protein [Dehalococcoidia bacterium]MDP6226373.1 DUF1847 domain-containing protein [Dehalococcoidia bacterium]MDP7084594.1 DUF1847 domain-containing protein [Dehalococcoidia bacterium]MDP7201450.1 DUF1847 domain-containing protein [Dehalococcoidia bacterium]MDP7509386.1 DUF1847 domain-containing protein [Dehalococcoidia bacterium]